MTTTAFSTFHARISSPLTIGFHAKFRAFVHCPMMLARSSSMHTLSFSSHLKHGSSFSSSGGREAQARQYRSCSLQSSSSFSTMSPVASGPVILATAVTSILPLLVTLATSVRPCLLAPKPDIEGDVDERKEHDRDEEPVSLTSVGHVTTISYS